MGLGLGGNMQPMILAVQNAASPREIGVSTSSVTFFRSMGGTLGAAVFLSVLFAILPDKIRTAFTAAAVDARSSRPAARGPPRPGPGAAAGRSRRRRRRCNDTSFINRLADALSHPFKVGFSESMSDRLPDRRGHHGGRPGRGVLPARAAAAPALRRPAGNEDAAAAEAEQARREDDRAGCCQREVPPASRTASGASADRQGWPQDASGSNGTADRRRLRRRLNHR